MGKQISFISDNFPVLEENQFTIEAVQDIQVFDEHENNEGADQFADQIDFFVSCRRLNIPAMELHSCYPPDKSEGDFRYHIPQITFMDEGLPWKRKLDVSSTVRRLPWLVLMVFWADEGTRKRELPFNEAFRIEKWNEVYIERELYPEERRGEKNEELCTVLDIPCDILIKLLPQACELPYMAHVRQVGVEQKEERLFTTEGRFSSLIGNRAILPAGRQESVRYEAHVLSLEGIEQFLAANEENRKIMSEGKKTVRMLRLAGWEFTMKSGSESPFPACAGHLKTGYLGEPDSGQVEKLDKEVGSLVSFGCRPMNYKLRDGRTTAAWYQPPLLPAQALFEKSETAKQLAEYTCLNHGDGGIAYLTDVQMLDVTYAAAWTLGRLLGMKNQAYLTALYDLRRLHYEKEKQDWNIRVVESLFMNGGEEGEGPAEVRLQGICSHQLAELLKEEK